MRKLSERAGGRCVTYPIGIGVWTAATSLVSASSSLLLSLDSSLALCQLFLSLPTTCKKTFFR